MTTVQLEVLVLDIGGTVLREGAGIGPDGNLAVELLPAVAEDLATLTGSLRITAATNTASMSSREVREHLDRAGIGRYFTEIVTSSDVGAAKPDPTTVIRAALAGGAGDMDAVLFIGDMPTDEEAARRAGVHFARVLPEGIAATVEKWREERKQ